jgi:hypothetical protein
MFPRIERRPLSNGLEVRAIVAPFGARGLDGAAGAGRVVCRRGDSAGCPRSMADLLDEGSRGRSALEVSDRIARIGGDLDVEVSTTPPWSA